MKRGYRVALLVLLLEVGIACVVDRYWYQGPKPPGVHLPYLFGPTLTSFTANPGTITFTSSNPDASTTSPTATITVNTGSAAWTRAWSLKVQALSSTMTNCSTVPVSAVTATCTSLVLSGSGGNPSGSCAGAPFALSTSLQTVASGVQGYSTDTYTTTLTFQFTDDWKYPGANSPACSVSLNYQFSTDY